jgi:hypothetical protein
MVIDLENLDATILQFDPDFRVEAIRPKAFRPPRDWSNRGQMTRIVLPISLLEARFLRHFFWHLWRRLDASPWRWSHLLDDASQVNLSGGQIHANALVFDDNVAFYDVLIPNLIGRYPVN